MKDIVILGAGGFAREVLQTINDINKEKGVKQWNVLGYIDENRENHGRIINGVKVLGDFGWLNGQNRSSLNIAFGVGFPSVKKKFFSLCTELGFFNFPNLIHPRAYIGEYVKLGRGNIIQQNTIVMPNAIIHNFVTFNIAVTVGHDTEYDDFCTIAPGTNISGFVKIGQGCDIGTSTAIIPGKKVGEWSIIGAGAVVTKDIPPFCTAVGCPAKPIKYHNGNSGENNG